MRRPFTRCLALVLSALVLLAPASVLARTKHNGTTVGTPVSPALQSAGVTTKAPNSTLSATGSTGATKNRAQPNGAAAGGVTTPTPATGTAGTATTTPATGIGGAPATGAAGSATTTPATTTPATPLTSTVVAATPTKKKAGSRHISTGAAIIAVLAALLLLGALAWALARRFAYEPTWWLGMRHSFSEASFRTSATWAEVRDWARIGR